MKLIIFLQMVANNGSLRNNLSSRFSSTRLADGYIQWHSCIKNVCPFVPANVHNAWINYKGGVTRATFFFFLNIIFLRVREGASLGSGKISGDK